MADAQMGPMNVKFVDKRRGRSHDGVAIAEATNMSTIALAKARLTALKPSAYTAARLNNMTSNDLIYALRIEGADAAGIK
jgi:hypothetical protein